MARPWRIQFQDATYHVASRGNGRQRIFFDDHDRDDFLKLAGRGAQRFNLEIFSFCLMSNHYHLLLRTPKANLSAAMQWLNTAYAVRFYNRHHRSGHLFQGRFKSVLVEDEKHWQHLSYYIHLNPVRAGMVENPAQYKWSSYLDYLRPKSRFEWLMRDEILSSLGRTRPRQRRNYRRQCLELAKKKPEFWKDVRDAVIIGSTDFIEKMKKQFSPSGRKEEFIDYRKLAMPGASLEQELNNLAKAWDVEPEMFERRAEHFPARLAAYYYLAEKCQFKQTQIAQHFKVSCHAVSKGIQRFQVRLKSSPALQKLMEMSNV